MDDSEDDVLAYMAFPPQHRTKLHSTNPLERLNKMGYPGQQACGGSLAIAA
jgi:transposase-like protein